MIVIYKSCVNILSLQMKIFAHKDLFYMLASPTLETNNTKENHLNLSSIC